MASLFLATARFDRDGKKIEGVLWSLCITHRAFPTSDRNSEEVSNLPEEA